MAMVAGTGRIGCFFRFHSRQSVGICRSSRFHRAFSSELQSQHKTMNVKQDLEQSGKRRRSGSKILLAVPALAGFSLGGVEGPESVLQALGVVTVIIMVHEAGHFLAARLQNIHVSKFSIGFGPKLARFRRKEVEYSIGAIPLGGYVGFPEDSPDNEFSPDDPDLLKNRPIWDRFLVMSAGVAANIVFAYALLFSQSVTVGLLQEQRLPGVVATSVVPNSPAARAGVKPSDLILGLNGEILPVDENGVVKIVNVVRESPERKLSFLIQRGEERFDMDILSDRNKDGTGKIGIQLSQHMNISRVKPKNFAEAAVGSTREFLKLTGAVLDGLKQIVVNFSKTADRVSGPVAIVAFGAEVARSDSAGLFQFGAAINLNLAVVNLLPLPALDGGYLALLALEAARGGKKIPKEIERWITSSGILLILGLGLVLMVRDTVNLGLVQGL